MAIDTTQEKLLPLKAAGQLPWLPKVIGENTLKGWVHRGFRGGALKLEHMYLGGMLCTSEEAMRRLCERLSLGPASDDKRTPGQARKSHQRASKELEEAGI